MVNTSNEENITLEDYSKELSLFSTITLKQLIDSHRDIRQENIRLKEKQNEVINKLVDVRVKEILTLDYIMIEELKKLTIKQIADLL